MKTLPGGGGGGVYDKGFIIREYLKEGDVHKLYLILGGAFIRGRRLKDGGHLLEDLPYSKYVIVHPKNYVNK